MLIPFSPTKTEAFHKQITCCYERSHHHDCMPNGCQIIMGCEITFVWWNQQADEMLRKWRSSLMDEHGRGSLWHGVWMEDTDLHSRRPARPGWWGLSRSSAGKPGKLRGGKAPGPTSTASWSKARDALGCSRWDLGSAPSGYTAPGSRPARTHSQDACKQ